MNYDYLKVKEYQSSELDISEIGKYYILSFERVNLKVSEQAKK